MATGFNKKRTAVNVASQWLVQLANIVITLLLIGYAVGALGAEHYGGWAAIVSIIGYLTMLDAGMSVSVQYYISRFSTAKEPGKLAEFYSSIYVVYLCAAFLGLVICLWLAENPDLLFGRLDAEIKAENSAALQWVAGGMFLFLASMPAQGALMGLQRHSVKNMIEILSLLARLLLVIGLFEFVQPSLEYLGLAFFAAALLRLVLCLFAIRKQGKVFVFRWEKISGASMKEVFSFGGHSTFWSVATAIVRESGPLLALLTMGATESTLVYVGTRLVRSVGVFIQSAGQVVMPIATSLKEQSDDHSMKFILLYGTRFCALLAFSGAAVLIVFSEAILYQWLGVDGISAYGVVLVTTLGMLGVWIHQVSLSIVMGSRILWPLTMMMLFRVAGCILFALVLGKYWGVTGLAAGLVIPVALTSLFYIPYLALKTVASSGRELAGQLVVPMLIGLLLAVLGYALRELLVPQSIGYLAVDLAIMAVVFAVLAYSWGIGKQARLQLTAKATKVLAERGILYGRVRAR